MIEMASSLPVRTALPRLGLGSVGQPPPGIQAINSEKRIMMVTKATTLSELRATRRQSERHIFTWLATAIVLLVFVGFSRTYYLHTLFKTPKLTIFLHVHAAVMTGWIALFAFQTFLITSGRIRIHRILGTFGADYAVLVVLMGTTATLVAARREVRAHSESVSSVLTVLALELTQMLLFGSLVGVRHLVEKSRRLPQATVAFGYLLHASESYCPPVHLGGIWEQHHDPDSVGVIGQRSRIA